MKFYNSRDKYTNQPLEKTQLITVANISTSLPKLVEKNGSATFRMNADYSLKVVGFLAVMSSPFVSPFVNPFVRPLVIKEFSAAMSSSRSDVVTQFIR